MCSNMFYFHPSFGNIANLTLEASIYLSPSFCFSLLQVLYNELLSDKRPGVRGLEKKSWPNTTCHVMMWAILMWQGQCGWILNWWFWVFSSCLYILIWRITLRSKTLLFFRWLRWISPDLVWLLEASTEHHWAEKINVTWWLRIGKSQHLRKMQLSSDMEVDFTSRFHVILLAESLSRCRTTKNSTSKLPLFLCCKSK